jgi:hypothetical protein
VTLVYSLDSRFNSRRHEGIPIWSGGDPRNEIQVYSDFTVLDSGVAYLTTDPDNSVVRYEPGKGLTTIAGGLNQTIVAGATACLFGKAEQDRDVLYVTTSGAHGGPINGTFTEPAKIVAITF